MQNIRFRMEFNHEQSIWDQVNAVSAAYLYSSRSLRLPPFFGTRRRLNGQHFMIRKNIEDAPEVLFGTQPSPVWRERIHDLLATWQRLADAIGIYFGCIFTLLFKYYEIKFFIPHMYKNSRIYLYLTLL